MSPQETASPEFMATTYYEYQKRYSQEMRKSDKVMLNLVLPFLQKSARRPFRLLDIGCSSGNFVAHLRDRAPDIEYWGGDIQPAVIERCRSEPHLKGIRFEVMNIRDLSAWPQFDAIVANAVLFRFSEEDLATICCSLASALTRSGPLFTFDFYHRFEQDLTIVDKSAWHPQGLMLHMRSYRTASRIFREANFEEPLFLPFRLPIDLPERTDPSDVGTYTRTTTDGERIMFRGVIYQPWCHMTTRKSDKGN